VILYTSGTLGIPEPEPELAGSMFLGLLSGNNSHYLNFSKPELPDPNFAGNPNAQGDEPPLPATPSPSLPSAILSWLLP
jgi:hypothetical protein